MPMTTSLRTKSGRAIATRSPTIPPSLHPSRCTGPPSSAVKNAIVSAAIASYVRGPSMSGVWPCPRRSGAITRNCADKSDVCSAQFAFVKSPP